MFRETSCRSAVNGLIRRREGGVKAGRVCVLLVHCSLVCVCVAERSCLCPSAGLFVCLFVTRTGLNDESAVVSVITSLSDLSGDFCKDKEEENRS